MTGDEFLTLLSLFILFGSLAYVYVKPRLARAIVWARGITPGVPVSTVHVEQHLPNIEPNEQHQDATNGSVDSEKTVLETETAPPQNTGEKQHERSLKNREDVIALLVDQGWSTTQIRNTVKGTAAEIGTIVAHYRRGAK